MFVKASGSQSENRSHPIIEFGLGNNVTVIQADQHSDKKGVNQRRATGGGGVWGERGEGVTMEAKAFVDDQAPVRVGHMVTRIETRNKDGVTLTVKHHCFNLV